MELSPRAKAILREIAATKTNEMSVGELVAFSPADEDLMDAKAESRWNAKALEELIRKGAVPLWVVDRWLGLESEWIEDVTVFPDLVAQSTEEGRAALE